MKFNRNKYILSLILILTITLNILQFTSSKSTFSTLSKIKALTNSKMYGKGDWSSGYQCPFIEIYDYTTKDKLSTTGKYFIQPTTFNQNLGFRLKLEETDRYLNHFLHTYKGKITYIPWRYFDEIFYYKKSLSFKVLEANLTNDKEQTIKIKFNMPFAFNRDIITQVDCLRLVSITENFRDYQRNQINSAKDALAIYFSKIKRLKNTKESIKISQKHIEKISSKSMKINQGILTQKKREIEIIDEKYYNLNEELYLLKANLIDIRENLALLQKNRENNLRLMDDGLRGELFKMNSRQIQDTTKVLSKSLSSLASNAPNVNYKKFFVYAMEGSVEKVSKFLMRMKPLQS